MKVTVALLWYDIWVGVFVDRAKRTVYVCPLPCVVFKIERTCAFRSNGGMHCAGTAKHDGPHTFTNREWVRTRSAAPTSRDSSGG